MTVSQRPTETTPDVTGVCAALSDVSKARMAMAMMDARAWTISELAAVAGIGRSTATEHAHRLVAAGICTEVKQGRHRYLRISDGRVADVLEALGTLSPLPRAGQSLRSIALDRALRHARTCYRHLAGSLGVHLADALRAQHVITPAWELSDWGRDWFTGLGIEVPMVIRQPLVRPCLDWTERRDHLAGHLGDALCTTFLDRGWIARRPGSRAVAFTDAGREALEVRGVDLHRTHDELTGARQALVGRSQPL